MPNEGCFGRDRVVAHAEGEAFVVDLEGKYLASLHLRLAHSCA